MSTSEECLGARSGRKRAEIARGQGGGGGGVIQEQTRLAVTGSHTALADRNATEGRRGRAHTLNQHTCATQPNSHDHTHSMAPAVAPGVAPGFNTDACAPAARSTHLAVAFEMKFFALFISRIVR